MNVYRIAALNHFQMKKYHIRKIAIATNFTPEADHALQYAVLLARRYNASLDIIHAVSPAESKNKKAIFVSAAYEKLKTKKAEMKSDHELEIKLFARVGEAEVFLHKYCIENKTDLLIIGVQTGVKKYFAATKAYKIIMKVECPVLSVPVSFKQHHFRSILLPLRDVSGVEDKILYTKPFIDKEGAALHIVNFGKIDTGKINEITGIAKSQGVEFNVKDLQDIAKKNIPAQVITIAKENANDLIVINATSEKEWYDIFGENYTEYILKESDIAVVSITHLFESQS